MDDLGILIFTLVVATVLVVGAIGCFLGARKLWRRLFGKEDPRIESVSVSFRLSDGDYGTAEERVGLQAFAHKLELLLKNAGDGQYDGDEFGGGVATLYFFGPSADRIWDMIESDIRTRSPLAATEATLLYGDYRAKRKTVRI